MSKLVTKGSESTVVQRIQDFKAVGRPVQTTRLGSIEATVTPVELHNLDTVRESPPVSKITLPKLPRKESSLTDESTAAFTGADSSSNGPSSEGARSPRTDALKNTPANRGGFFSWMGKAVGNFAAKAIEGPTSVLREQAQQFLDDQSPKATAEIAKLGEVVLTQQLQPIVATGQATVEALERIVDTAAKTVPDSIEKVGQTVNKVVDNTITGLRKEAEQFADHLATETAPNVRKEIEQTVDHIAETFSKTADNLIEKKIQPAVETLAKTGKQLGEDAKATGEKVSDAITAVADRYTNSGKRMKKRLKKALITLVIASTIPSVSLLLIEILRFIEFRQKLEHDQEEGNS